MESQPTEKIADKSLLNEILRMNAKVGIDEVIEQIKNIQRVMDDEIKLPNLNVILNREQKLKLGVEGETFMSCKIIEESIMEKKVALIGSGSLLPSQCNASASLKGYTVPCGTGNTGKPLSKKKIKKNLQKERRKIN